MIHWTLFIVGSLLLATNVDKVGQRTEDGATAFTWSLVGAVLAAVGAMYVLGVVS